jgi:hypothetical protein
MDVVDADDYVIGEAPAPIAVVTDNRLDGAQRLVGLTQRDGDALG